MAIAQPEARDMAAPSFTVTIERMLRSFAIQSLSDRNVESGTPTMNSKFDLTQSTTSNMLGLGPAASTKLEYVTAVSVSSNTNAFFILVMCGRHLYPHLFPRIFLATVSIALNDARNT